MIIEITRLIGRTLKGYPLTGIDRVCIEYLNYFKTHTKTSILIHNKISVFDQSMSNRLIESLRNQNISSLIKSLFIAPFHIDKAQDGELYINLTHSGGIESENFMKKVCNKNMVKIFMIHDLIPIDHPEFTRDGEKERHEIRLRNMIEFGDLILTNSNYTKDRLLEYSNKTFKKDISNKVEVNYLGFSTKLSEAEYANFEETINKYQIKENYFTVLSTIEPRKNHIILFYAWKELFKILGNRTPMLLFIGRRGWKIDYLINLIKSSNMSHLIKEINNCSDSELKTLLKNSQALLMPSIDEGFGLPVLEAIMLGCLTVCSNIPVFNELFGNIPYYCNWNNAAEWREIVLEILSSRDKMLDRQIENTLLEREKLNRYTWDSHFERLRNILIKHRISEASLKEAKGELKFATKW